MSGSRHLTTLKAMLTCSVTRGDPMILANPQYEAMSPEQKVVWHTMKFWELTYREKKLAQRHARAARIIRNQYGIDT